MPGRNGVRLVIADVDGTLVTDDKRLTDRAVAAARQLRAADIPLMITSGRPPRGLRMLTRPLGLTTPMAAFNGGMFVAPDLSVLRQHTVPDDLLQPLHALLTEEGLDTWVYSGTRWLVTRPSAPHVAREAATVRFRPTVVASVDGVREVVKMVGVSDDGSAVARAVEAIQARFGHDVSAARSQPYYLDITHPEANKGAVVDEAVATFGVPASAVAVIGDMPNDLLMFEKAGLSIAMANATSEVRSQADLVTGSNNEDGFADAIERFVLGQMAPHADGGERGSCDAPNVGQELP